MLLFFLPPIAFLLLRLVMPHPTGSVAQTARQVLGIATVAVAPVVASIVGRLLAPHYFTLPGRRLKAALAAIVAIVALIGFLVGHFNDRLLTCAEFVVAGDNPPPNCARVEK
ncbi:MULTISPECIES: hypothetical protein [unclassified Micromonospora]|uniref:hypothetical protein n=1 Tax=unclassified Micromonospora TaxID=2617518 RepID=UPI0013D28747|nr:MULTISPECIES: hypothetical protein [unclassified Micromonospora]NES15958.1 hypothetical protein [Micromonospora sp. PPF5-17B]NES58875.1 hypothetical protein [Micromonospora sp. PPF5-6]